MKKLKLLIVLLIQAFFLNAQNSLQVTDFVFFNNFNTPANPNLTDFFSENSDGLNQTQDLLFTILQQNFEVSEISFYEEGVSFLDNLIESNNSKSYKENHKTLIKAKKYSTYLSLISSIELTNQLDPTEGYFFDLKVRISSSKGKKIFNGSTKVPFSVLFPEDKIVNSELLNSEGFYQLFASAISAAFSDESELTPVTFYRDLDTEFDSFLSSATRYEVGAYKSLNAVLKDAENNETTLSVRGGTESDIDISNAGGGSLVYGEKLNPPIYIGIQNSDLTNHWSVVIQGKTNSDFQELDVLPSANISLRIGKQPMNTFKLINGRFIGRLNNKNYMISYKPSAGLLSIFVNQEMVALSQPVKEGKDVKLYFDGPQNELSTIVNLHQIYYQSLDLLNQNK